MNRSEFIDYLLEKGKCNRFDEHQIDALEQFCFCLYDNTELDNLAERIVELKKGYEELRIASLYAVCKMSGGQAKADLRDAYDKATDYLKALEE